MSLFPGADISTVFKNIEGPGQQDKGEDKPGGCQSSLVPIYWLYLINTDEQETVQVNEDKGEDRPGGCHSSPVPIFQLYLINTKE